MRNRLSSWLAREDALENVDLIFVLAGRPRRKEYALQLLQQGRSRQVLFSVGRFEIRRFPQLGLPHSPDLLDMAKSIPPPRRHFFVLFRDAHFDVKRVPVRKLGTLTEIDALADWLASHPEISSLSFVTSGPHLFRVRLCCRSLLSPNLKTRFWSVPQPDSPAGGTGSQAPLLVLSEILRELLKVACYSLCLPLWRFARRWRSQTIATLNH